MGLPDPSHISNAEYLQAKPGVYILSRDSLQPCYVGRSDRDLAACVAGTAAKKGCKWFWFRYATSPVEAYHFECKLYHGYDLLENEEHPKPPSPDVRCRYCGE
jgi:hypothetical protein